MYSQIIPKLYRLLKESGANMETFHTFGPTMKKVVCGYRKEETMREFGWFVMIKANNWYEDYFGNQDKFKMEMHFDIGAYVTITW